MAPTPAQVLAAVKRSGVKYELCDGWDDPANAADGIWAPAYVIQHHTANGGATGNNPSLNWVLHNEYHPIRACHFLIGRDGTVFVVYALKCYHAGKGGPGHWGDGPAVQVDSMNGRAFGIEVESKGMSTVASDVDGFTPAQFDALARLDAALLDLLGAKGEGRVINHRTWAPTRKVDTRYTDATLQANARTARARLNAVPAKPANAGDHERTPAPFTASAYRMPTHGPVVATMRQALRLPAGDHWDATLKAAWGGYLLRHPWLIAAGNRSVQINARGYASLVKNL